MKILEILYCSVQYLFRSIFGPGEIPVFLFGNDGHKQQLELPLYSNLPERKTIHAIGYDTQIRAIVNLKFDKKYPERREVLWDFESEADPSIAINTCGSSYVLKPGESVYVGLGIVLGLPPYWWCEVRPRSSTVPQNLKLWYEEIPIDPDFRAEPVIRIQNLGDKDVLIQRGMRLGQLVFNGPLGRWNPRLYHVKSMSELSRTKRGNGCHGSTGCY